MHLRSAREIRLMAEQLLIRAASAWCSERRSRRLRDRASILSDAAAMAERREREEKAQRASCIVQAENLRPPMEETA